MEFITFVKFYHSWLQGKIFVLPHFRTLKLNLKLYLDFPLTFAFVYHPAADFIFAIWEPPPVPAVVCVCMMKKKGEERKKTLLAVTRSQEQQQYVRANIYLLEAWQK